MNQISSLIITADTLAGITLFSSLDRTAREKIAAKMSGRRYRADTTIVSQHDTTREVSFVVSGGVRVIYYFRHGGELNFRDLEAGAMFGEVSAIDGQPRSARVVARQETVLAIASTEMFMELLKEYPVLTREVLSHFAGLVRALSERVLEISSLSVTNRIHAELLRLATQHGVVANTATIKSSLTQTEFAARVGTHREAVSREFAELKKLGILARTQPLLTICDVTQLRALVEKFARL